MGNTKLDADGVTVSAFATGRNVFLPIVGTAWYRKSFTDKPEWAN